MPNYVVLVCEETGNVKIPYTEIDIKLGNHYYCDEKANKILTYTPRKVWSSDPIPEKAVIEFAKHAWKKRKEQRENNVTETTDKEKASSEV